MAKDRELAASRQEARQRKKIKKLLNFDYTLLLIVIFILAFGLVMLYSTSAYAASLKMGNSVFYLKKQASAAALGFVGMFFSTKIDYRRWSALVWPIYLGATALCILVIFAGTTLNNSTRWLRIGGISFQPSELAKVAVILLIASIIDRAPKAQRTFQGSIMTLALVIPIFTIVAYSNLSTAVIILGIAYFPVSQQPW